MKVPVCAAVFAAAALMIPTVSRADDVWKVTTEITSAVEVGKNYPDLIKVTVKKNDQNPPDQTAVVVERITGDALLLDPDTKKVGAIANLKTTGGTASATVFMGSATRDVFTVRVMDASGVMFPNAQDAVIVGTEGLTAVGGPECTHVRDTEVKVGERTLVADDRCRTEVSVYTGMVIDSFAAKVLNDYINPNDANDLKTSFIAGFDVAQYVGKNTWLYIETVNGVRSATVDCGANPKAEVCTQNSAENANGKLLYILRNARSLEAMMGVRHEFPYSKSGRFYLKSQLGFIDVAGSGLDIIDNHLFLAGGYMTGDSRFRDSYIEAGFGKSDIFDSYENRRFKFDGYLTAPISDSKSTRWFLQMTVDSDFRSGPDSVQIYMGVDFDLRRFSLHL